jgi:hypothetical protein
MSSPDEDTFGERVLELLFFFKVYKLYKFHKKTIFALIGTFLYPIYKVTICIFQVFFAILITFSMLSYLSSIFYAIDYAIYQFGGPLSSFIWLVDMGSEPDLIQKSFWTQLLMINYWAIGTTSTAAYGDICG